MSDEPRDEDTISHTRDVVEGRAAPDPKQLATLVTLVQKHQSRIYNVCYRITRDPQLSQDLVQDALATAITNLAKFDQRSTLSTWICGIARNLAMAKVRRRGELLTEDGVVEPTDAGSSVLQCLSSAERIAVVRQTAKACLDAQEQQVVHLRYTENLPYEAIAGCMDLEGGANAVRVLLQRASRKLKPALGERLTAMGHGMSFVVTRDGPDDH